MHKQKSTAELEAEIERLHAFILRVSERLFLAAEVLSIKAEKKEKRKDTNDEFSG